MDMFAKNPTMLNWNYKNSESITYRLDISAEDDEAYLDGGNSTTLTASRRPSLLQESHILSQKHTLRAEKLNELNHCLKSSDVIS